MERTKGLPGDAAIGPAAKPPGPPCRLTPGPPLRGTHSWGRSSHPARAGQGIAFLSAPLPLVGQFRESPAGWTMESAPGASSRRSWFGERRAGGDTGPYAKPLDFCGRMVSAPTESAAGKPKKAREGRKFPRPDSGDGKSAPDEYIRRWCGWNFGPKPEFFDTRGEEATQKRFFSRPSYHSPQRHIKGISLKSQ